MLYDAIAGSNGFFNSPVDPGALALLAAWLAVCGAVRGLPLPCCLPPPAVLGVRLVAAAGLCRRCPAQPALS